MSQFSIVPSPSMKETLDRILEEAHSRGLALHLNPAPVHYLIFCAPEHAEKVRLCYAASGTVETEAAVIEIDPKAIHVDQDCEPASRRRMESFVRWVLQTFAPCRVLDHQDERDLSLIATRNPDVLFAAEK